ncbi:colanic acid exporter [compost metagenome]
MTGTAISQVIAIALTPILTRNYSPEDFGYYTTFIAVYTILCSFATGKYERVIFLCKSENDIVIVSSLGVTISLLFSVFFSIIVYITSLFFDPSLWGISPLLLSWLYSIPFLIVINSINLIFLTYLGYKKNFKEVSKSRVIKTLVSISVSLICIFFLKNMGGLVLGELLGLLISTAYLAPKLKFMIQFNRKITAQFFSFASKYKNFPLYNIPGDLMANASSQIPVFFLTPFYGVQVTGQYSLMRRVLDAPINLVSSSILEVFRQKASEQYLTFGNCRNLFVRTAKNLAVLSILPFSILMIFGSDIFAFAFGEEWHTAGEFAGILALYYFFRFVVSPLSYIFYIAEKQKADFLMQLYTFASSLTIFYLPKFYANSISISETLWLYCFNFIIIYITYFLLSYKYSIK